MLKYFLSNFSVYFSCGRQASNSLKTINGESQIFPNKEPIKTYTVTGKNYEFFTYTFSYILTSI